MSAFSDIRDDGTIDGRIVETHYLHVEWIDVLPDDDGMSHLIVCLDGPGVDYECRIPLRDVKNEAFSRDVEISRLTRELAEATTRAEAAEAKLAKIASLPEQWRKAKVVIPTVGTQSFVQSTIHADICAAELQAALEGKE